MSLSPSLCATLDLAFAYPERASFNCPVRARKHLEKFLADRHDLIYEADGLLAWSGCGDTVAGVMYMATSVQVLEQHMAPMLARFEAGWRTRGISHVQLLAASPEAGALFEAHGFGIQNRAVRMRLAPPTPRTQDRRLRPATAADAEVLYPIVQATFPDLDYPLDTWRAGLASNPHGWQVVEGTRALGYIVAEQTESTVMINGLGVLPETQGRGVGKALVDAAVQLAVETGKEAVQVLSDDVPRTVAFYERYGFEAQHPAFFLTYRPNL